MDAFGEGVHVLTPFFRRLPRAFAQLMGALASEYLNACQAAGRGPDEELLEPVVEVLQRLAEEDAP